MSVEKVIHVEASMSAHHAALNSLREATGKPVAPLDVAVALAVALGDVAGLAAMQGVTAEQLSDLNDIATDHYQSAMRFIAERECAGSA